MADDYKEYLATRLARSAPLQGPYARTWFTAVGDVLDALATRFRDAILARFPERAQYDALQAIGDERLIDRGPNESLDSYRARLVGAWDTWPYAGTALGLLTALRLAGFTNAYLLIAKGVQYSLDGGGALVVTPLPGGWRPRSTGAFWSEFTVVFYPPPPILTPVPSSTGDVANTLRRLIQRWKPAHASCDRIIILESGKIWGFPASQVWGAGTGNWGPAVVTYWTP